MASHRSRIANSSRLCRLSRSNEPVFWPNPRSTEDARFPLHIVAGQAMMQPVSLAPSNYGPSSRFLSLHWPGRRAGCHCTTSHKCPTNHRAPGFCTYANGCPALWSTRHGHAAVPTRACPYPRHGFVACKKYVFLRIDLPTFFGDDRCVTSAKRTHKDRTYQGTDHKGTT